MLTRDTFPVPFLKWTDVTLEYIELVKSGLQQWFVLDFTNPTLHHAQLLKGVQGAYHYFKKFR
ncbi:(R)-mandelonitrile lyase 1-like [Cucumis melo var. makuwa]|uniref:(R)-mandelonitrile lyase 1-like n=1 Tax=Cucumis melo var. makuwa TaxID=1194695 RepID=A0A5A7VHU6_CUCMM|nr:(R)-mandelonitrile lyase 1-like [Cucumis melo var. makuwa]TYJ97702.1 (R)-mandelonitrile lyase 1-like [Cucumis melo var. makuwa]